MCNNVVIKHLTTPQPKAQDRQTEACAYWRERDHCGWTGTKPGRPDTNTSFNTPDIQRDGSNTA